MACEESSSISIEFKMKGKPANLVDSPLKPICPSGILSLELTRVGEGYRHFTASSHHQLGSSL